LHCTVPVCREIVEAVTTVFPANRVAVRLTPNGGYNDMGSADNYETFTYIIKEVL
jgi:N-ethylmaleimide reductase